jgi:hypothetical protein
MDHPITSTTFGMDHPITSTTFGMDHPSTTFGMDHRMDHPGWITIRMDHHCTQTGSGSQVCPGPQ